VNALVFILLSAAVVLSAVIGVVLSVSAGVILTWCGMLVLAAILVVRTSIRNAPSDTRTRMEIALDLAALREMHEAAGRSTDRSGARSI